MSFSTGVSLLRMLIMCGIFFAPIVVWSINVGNPLIYLENQVPRGQVQYVLSKLFGLYAIFLMWLQVLLAVAGERRKLAIIPKPSLSTHMWLGVSTLLVAIIHAGGFVWAVSLRTEHFAVDVLWPSLSSGYYKFAVSLGVFGLWALGLVGLSGRMRRNRHSAIWTYLHKLSLLSFLLVFLHGFLIGTESRQGVLFYFYAGLAGSLFIAVFYRLAGLLKAPIKTLVIKDTKG